MPYPLLSGHYNKVCMSDEWARAWTKYYQEVTRQQGTICPWKGALACMARDEPRRSGAIFGAPADGESQSRGDCKVTCYDPNDAYKHACHFRRNSPTGDLVTRTLSIVIDCASRVHMIRTNLTTVSNVIHAHYYT